MAKQEKNYDTSSVILVNTICKIRTYFDIIGYTSKSLNECNVDSDLWNVIITGFSDLLIIESYKLVDESNLSLFHLINKVKEEVPDKKPELEQDYSDLRNITNPHGSRCQLIQHRHLRKAHLAKKPSPSTLPRFVDFNEILTILDFSEKLISKYNNWIKGPKNSLRFNSMFAPNHDNILKEINSLIKYYPIQ